MTQSIFIGSGHAPYDLILDIKEGDVHHETIRLQPNQNWQGYIWSGRTITIQEVSTQTNET